MKTDTPLRNDIRAELNWAPEVKTSDIGVTGVSNLVKVKPKPSPADVEKKIHDALSRQADREARQLAITVDGSQVTLRGTVHSWTERDAVQGAAWATPGVTVVVNDLLVDA